MNDGLNSQPGNDPIELDDDSTGTWIVVTEDSSWYLDLNERIIVGIHRDERDSGARDPDAAPRFRLDDEVFIVAQITVCRVGQAFLIEVLVGDPLRPRIAINKPVVAIFSALSK